MLLVRILLGSGVSSMGLGLGPCKCKRKHEQPGVVGAGQSCCGQCDIKRMFRFFPCCELVTGLSEMICEDMILALQ